MMIRILIRIIPGNDNRSMSTKASEGAIAMAKDIDVLKIAIPWRMMCLGIVSEANVLVDVETKPQSNPCTIHENSRKITLTESE